VIHSIKRCEELLETENEFSGKIKNIEQRLEQRF
jgi:hypothetical protein